MALNLKRHTLEGEEYTFSFAEKSCNFLVKNFTEDAIYVSFVTPLVEDDSIKIMPSFGQICTYNQLPGANEHASKTLYVKGTGEVEVQAL